MDATRLESGAVGQLAEDEKRAGTRECATARVEEELRAIPPVEMRAAERQIAANGLSGRSTERHEALLAALAEHADDALLDRHAPFLESGCLRHAEPRAVEQLHERPIAKRAWRRADRGIDESLGLGGRERTWQCASLSR